MTGYTDGGANSNDNDGEEDGHNDHSQQPQPHPQAPREAVFLHRHGDGALPNESEIIDAISSNVELLAASMRANQPEDAAATAQDEAEIEQLRSMIRETRALAEENVALRRTNQIDAALLNLGGGFTASTNDDDGGGGGGTTNAFSSSTGDEPTTNSTIQLSPEEAAQLADIILEAPGITNEALVREILSMTEREQDDLYSDIHGRKPTNIEQVETCLAKLEEEIAKIPPEEKQALRRAQDVSPLLCYSARHTTLFLQAENFDAGRAAKVSQNEFAFPFGLRAVLRLAIRFHVYTCM